MKLLGAELAVALRIAADATGLAATTNGMDDLTLPTPESPEVRTDDPAALAMELDAEARLRTPDEAASLARFDIGRIASVLIQKSVPPTAANSRNSDSFSFVTATNQTLLATSQLARAVLSAPFASSSNVCWTSWTPAIETLTRGYIAYVRPPLRPCAPECRRPVLAGGGGLLGRPRTALRGSYMRAAVVDPNDGASRQAGPLRRSQRRL